MLQLGLFDQVAARRTAHCRSCDPTKEPFNVRELARMRTEALEAALVDLPAEASAENDPDERAHLTARVDLCRRALLLQKREPRLKRGLG